MDISESVRLAMLVAFTKLYRNLKLSRRRSAKFGVFCLAEFVNIRLPVSRRRSAKFEVFCLAELVNIRLPVWLNIWSMKGRKVGVFVKNIKKTSKLSRRRTTLLGIY